MRLFENQLAIGTSGLGQHPSHALDAKLREASKHGFTGIEIVFGDLECYSQLHKISMSAVAEQIRQLCDDLGLHVLSLCPFENFEGSNFPIEERLQKAKRWMDLARILKAEHIQIPAQFDKMASNEESTIVSELQQLADLGTEAYPHVKLAYEPMGWSIRYTTWESVLHLTKLVNRVNFGICLDSFHIATVLWGDPTVPSGKKPNADQNLSESLHRLVNTLPLQNLFYVQLSDGEKFDPLYSKEHPWYLEGEDAQFTWSKHARPFPLEKELGGYMPVVEIVRGLVVDMGFKGWVSLETFDRRMKAEGFEVEDGGRRAERSIENLQGILDGRYSHI
ncbi:AP endonuclease, family 2 [Massarina eburnea CBS 473.64]|uniref:AP endonuclease, family 2 n=1 Tax=Massarina eburnea CBS 473.64 TaxID=1395130 RepID=A0A6A6RPR8_9PLEO|nr:AP endonuclease, family 2 [Massarina eburnea CBS 473.64]